MAANFSIPTIILPGPNFSSFGEILAGRQQFYCNSLAKEQVGRRN
jgi:hypothetical protein